MVVRCGVKGGVEDWWWWWWLVRGGGEVVRLVRLVGWNCHSVNISWCGVRPAHPTHPYPTHHTHLPGPILARVSRFWMTRERVQLGVQL